MSEAVPNHKHVVITDENGKVDKDEIELWRGTGEHVVWSASVTKGFRVVFDGPEGSPFESAAFEVPAGGVVHSGEPKKGGRYKYTVHGPSGINDPIIIIKP
jgi:hypothetical protein